MPNEPDAQTYWQQLAAAYSSVGPPLMPSPEDTGLMRAAFEHFTSGSRRRHALLLGVTPSLANIELDDGWSLTAVDKSFAMVRGVWPGDIISRRRAFCGDWARLPLEDASCNIVLGDGAMNCVPYPEGARALASSVRRVMSDAAILALRCYIPPEPHETPDDVFRDLMEGSIATFHQFKFRILIAMQERTDQGIAVKDVYEAWRRHVDREKLIMRTGWEPRDIDTIEMYKGRDTVHYFPALGEFRTLLGEFFEEVTLWRPNYVLGECCPTMVWKRREESR